MKFDLSQYLTIQEVADARDCTTAAVYSLITAKKLKETLILGRKMIARKDLASLTVSKAGGKRPGQGRPKAADGREAPGVKAC